MKIGFLPLYLKLYDDFCKADAKAARKTASQAAAKLQAKGMEIVAAPVCRIAPEFKLAVQQFEEAGCEAILTLHLAYSPAMESIDAIAGTDLPVVIMDTTPFASFTDPVTQLMASHGIHGVQDFGNLLNRRHKPFLIAAGQFDNALLDRIEALLKSAVMSHKMKHLRIGRVGGEFEGMGDFRFDPADLGMKEVLFDKAPKISAKEVAAEVALDKKRFVFQGVSPEDHTRSVRAGLILRRWAAREKLDGFTMNFLHTERAGGWETVPFLECSKSMASGIGYAGEGDTLTAGLHAALFRGFPECGFSEMFCPDWKGNRIFVSHMGEINLALAVGKPVLAMRKYTFSDTGDPAVAYGCFKPGSAHWVNLAPLSDGKFRLITIPLEFQKVKPEEKKLARNTGWFCPEHGTIAEMLENYTRLGGTHHAVVVYNGSTEIFRDFAYLMQWEFAAL